MAVQINKREYTSVKTKATNNQDPGRAKPTDRKSPVLSDKIQDKFDNNPINKRIFNRVAPKDIKRKQNIVTPEASKIPVPIISEECKEQKFIKNPNFKAFQKLVKSFDNCYEMNNQAKFLRLNEFMIGTKANAITELPLPVIDSYITGDPKKLEAWHDKKDREFQKEMGKVLKRNNKRTKLIEAKGQGIGGRMTKIIGNTKEASYFSKNNLTLRGNMFRINNELWGKSIYEMLPRYGSRKGRHIGVRVSQFAINTILVAAGYGCAPISFGASVIVSNQLQTAVTLTGEVFALKLGGAKKRKIASHVALRGVQLEILRIPVAGTVINYGENILFGTAAAGIVSTTIADWLFDSMCTRYTQTLNIDDLGDSNVLFEMNQRIDYLSRFLIPNGQYLLLNESDPSHQTKLRKTLKRLSKLLKDLEHKNLKALNYYRLALIAGKIPASERPKIAKACKLAQRNVRMKTHRTVRQCLATLMTTNSVKETQS